MSEALKLPPRVPLQVARAVQSNIPSRRADRDRLGRTARAYVDAQHLTPPLAMSELREHADRLLADAGDPAIWSDYLAVLLNNAAWRDDLAGVPYHKRLLLLPKCLRISARCPAPFDALGLLCKSCGLCSLQDLTAEAEALGYVVLVAEGSAVVRTLIETGQVEAVVGVACLHVLEKSFPHLESGAVPGLAIPLLQDDCIDTTVDLDHVWEIIHLTSEDRAWRLDLDALRDDVRGWFTDPQALDAIAGPATDPTSALARRALAQDGKRWRPFLAMCAWLALRADAGDPAPAPDDDCRKLAVAVECFHKASLIHDDLEDGDERRGEHPTMHATHGADVAINAGDLLLGEGYRLLAELDSPARAAILRVAAVGHVTLCRGQGAELLARKSGALQTSLEVLEVFRNKTAPAFEVALATGALLAGAGPEVLAVLAAWSEAVGIAYQIRDDLEDCEVLGADGRGSMLLALARKRVGGVGGPDREIIDAASSGARPLDADVVAVLRRHGVLDLALQLQRSWEEAAIRALRDLEQPTLKGLLRRVVGKVFPQELVEGVCREHAQVQGVDRA